MMENLPFYIGALMVLCTLLSIFFIYRASKNSNRLLLIFAVWLSFQFAVSRTGFYTDTQTLPPRFLLAVLPPLFAIIFLFATKKGRSFIDRLEPEFLSLLHLVRIPVELVLFVLFLNRAVPKVMTFGGNNFDIISGISAPFIWYFSFKRNLLCKKVIVFWNLLCLALLINVIATAILAVPTPFQKIGFEQPNIAVLYFPFIWLPCCIVQLVLFSHLVMIRKYLQT